MRESEFQAKIVKFLRQRDALVFNFSGSKFQSGIPDLYINHLYWEGWMELKMPNGALTAQQKHNLLELRRHGAKAYLIRLMPSSWVRLSDPTESVHADFETFEALWGHLVKDERKDS